MNIDVQQKIFVDATTYRHKEAPLAFYMGVVCYIVNQYTEIYLICTYAIHKSPDQRAPDSNRKIF